MRLRSNNEFTHIKVRKEGGGCCRSLFRFVLILPVLLVLLWACSHEGIDAYASGQFFRPPNDSEEMQGFMVYSETYNVGNSVFTYAPDNLQFHYRTRKQKPTWFVNAPTATYNLRADYISYHAVDYNGTKYWYRLILYDATGECFRSGLMRSDDKVNVRGINFLTYDVYIINLDDDGNVIQASSTGPMIRHTLGYIYYSPTPTEPHGQEEYIETTDYVNLDDFSGVQMPTWGFRDHDEMGGFLNFARFVGDNWRFVLGLRWAGFIFGTCIMISLTLFIMRGR